MSSDKKVMSKVGLSIKSEVITAEEISGLIGMKYSKKIKVGENLGLNVKSEYNIWMLRIENTHNNSIEELVERILEYIEPVKKKIKELPKNCDVYIDCEVEEYEEPEYFFSKDILRKIVDINASIWIDQYIYEKEDNPNEGWISLEEIKNNEV